ncbi:MAG: hypothetical protein ABL983_20095, partial [Nitrospira sp.]
TPHRILQPCFPALLPLEKVKNQKTLVGRAQLGSSQPPLSEWSIVAPRWTDFLSILLEVVDKLSDH